MDNVGKITSLESEVQFFFPVLEGYIGNLTLAFNKSKNKDYSGATWQLIQENGQIGNFLNPHVLLISWEQMQLFLKKERKLHCFIETKHSGLMEENYTFWLFFSPDTATGFFKNQVNRPKEFKPSAIIGLPFIKLLEPIYTKLDHLQKDSEISTIDKTRKIVEILELGELYLNEQDRTVLDDQIKKGVKTTVVAEAKSLLESIGNPRVSSMVLEKRLANLFRIGWRFLRTKNELESKYFKKLLSQENSEREKGLRLTLKKAMDL